ncbi:MAG: hypothetical protein CMI09_13250 [Oceanospirillaceae bacterium]|nr:hypothetical protein [Oceanospirillaceae bacterium]|tara:strand:+ start:820 stop:1491 length:672 start_codon:yes stop_codon:yes gene_type:complete
MDMNIRGISLLVALGLSLQANGEGYRQYQQVGFHAGQASDTAKAGWWQLSVGHRWKKRTHEFRINSGYLRLDDQRSGLADTWLRASWLFQRPWLRQWWDVQWRMKLPTARSDNGLGTGSVDNELRGQALVQWKPVLGWYYAGYRLRGQSPEYDVQHGYSWGAGAGLKGWSLVYDGRESAFSGQPSLHNISLIHQLKVGRQTRISPYVRWRTNGEWGAGIGIRW